MSQEYCNNCNGTGYVRNGYDGEARCMFCNPPICPICGYMGDYADCPTCNNSGLDKGMCPTCRGEGYVEWCKSCEKIID